MWFHFNNNKISYQLNDFIEKTTHMNDDYRIMSYDKITLL